MFSRFSSKLCGVLILFFGLSYTTIAQQHVTIEPEKPGPGEKVTITYHPEHTDATIESPESLTLVLSFAPYLYSQPNEMESQKTENGWQTSFQLSDEFKYASFYFKSGDNTDKSIGGNHFEFFAYQDGKPVEGAHLLKAHSLKRRYEDVKNINADMLADLKAAAYLKEVALYPDSYDGWINMYEYQLQQDEADSDAIKEKAYALIDEKLAEDPGSWEVISDVKSGYKKIGEKARGDSVQQAMIEQYPESDIAMYDLYRKANDEEDPEKQAEMFEEYLNADFERSFINRLYAERAVQKLFEYYAEQGDLEKARQLADQWVESKPPLLESLVKSSNYNSVAQTLVEHTDSYDMALEYAQKALRITDDEPAMSITTTSGKKMRYLPEEQRRNYKDRRKSEILSTLGQIFLKQKKYDEAEEHLTGAIDLSSSKSAQKNMAGLYLKTDRPEQAFDSYWDILMEEPTDEEVREQLKQAYVAYNGSEEGFKDETQKLDEAWREQMIEKFNNERIDEKAPSLNNITDLKGNPVDASLFQDKIVAVDFWATWCGPCLSAFPYLQKVYESYEDHPQVEFIVLNSAWNNTLKDAREWQKENEEKYSFPLYFDKDSEITEAFGVRGIPTTFFIDKEGKTQFQKRGFEGPTMEPKMKLQIEMLLDDEKTAEAATSSGE